MKSTLLSSYSNFGKYKITNCQSQQNSINFTSITFRQNYIHQRPFIYCKFDITGNRIYLLDNKDILMQLNLFNNSFSTLKNQKIKHFIIDCNNSLNLLYVTPQSQLYKISFNNKKPIKIMNLNMSRILAFERNYLREMLLVLDYKLLFLCDLTNISKIKSLKAGYNQTFVKACFASNNYFLILASKNGQIKILEIQNLEQIHKIRLPFLIQNLKLQVSYDSKKIAIYGNCQLIFFINIQKKMQFSYEVIQIPFLKNIYQLKYTHQNQLILLGNDQIIYVICPTQPTKAIPIFNYNLKLMKFDISLDSKKMILVANRTVYQLKFNKSFRKVIQQQQSYKIIQYKKNIFDKINCINNQDNNNFNENKKQQINYQYDDEDYSQEQQNQQLKQQSIIKLNQNIKIINNLPKILDYTDIKLNPLIQQIKINGINKKQKIHINQIFNYIFSNFRYITIGQQKNFINTITKLYILTGKQANKCINLCHYIFNNISQEFQKCQHYGYVLCPRIISILQKRFKINFLQFFKQNMSQLFLHYFQQIQQLKLLNWIITKFNYPQTIPLLFIATLQQVISLIQQRQEQWQELICPLRCLVTFSNVLNRFQKIIKDNRYKNMLQTKKKLSDYVLLPRENPLPPVYTQDQTNILFQKNLERLLMKQQQIKKALNKKQDQKPVD